MTASGLHRGSIYQAFGSKRGLFLAVLTRLVPSSIQSDDSIDLVLVALLELAPRDAEIRGLVGTILASAGPEAPPNASEGGCSNAPNSAAIHH